MFILFRSFLIFFLLNLITGNVVAVEKIRLTRFENKVYSQNGEDGVIKKIFETIGTTNKFFVEFGVEDGGECNTRFLRENKLWNGLMMDGSHENPGINLHKEFITAENIISLFKKHSVPQEFDLLSIDIDLNDFYIWYALKNYRPRVVVIEYNSMHTPFEDNVIVYNPYEMWDKTNYFGASILALQKLGRLLGYTLVYAEKRGVNLFFIRDDIEEKNKFLFADEVEKIYQAPKFGTGPNGGHVKDPLHREFITSDKAIELITEILHAIP